MESSCGKYCGQSNKVIWLCIRRNLYPCSENTTRSAYVTIVRQNLEYATAVWDPYRQEQIDSIEAVQRRAARFIKETITELLPLQKCYSH